MGLEPSMPPPSRFKIRYGVVYCEVCGMAVPYCPGHAEKDVPSADHAASDSLAKRIAEVKQ